MTPVRDYPQTTIESIGAGAWPPGSLGAARLAGRARRRLRSAVSGVLQTLSAIAAGGAQPALLVARVVAGGSACHVLIDHAPGIGVGGGGEWSSIQYGREGERGRLR